MQLHHYSTIQNTIVVPYIDGLYRYAMSITRNPAEAEDLVQETYVRAIRAMGSLGACSNHKSWLFTILRNLRINQLRRQRTAPGLVRVQSRGYIRMKQQSLFRTDRPAR